MSAIDLGPAVDRTASETVSVDGADANCAHVNGVSADQATGATGPAGARSAGRGVRRADRPRLRIVVQPVRPSRWAISVMITAAIAAFAAVGINVARVEGQRRLDSVHSELATEQARTDALRRRESKIQSPAEVVRIATEELGLIPAAAPVAVAAPAQVVAPPATSPPPPTPSANSTSANSTAANSAPANKAPGKSGDTTPTGN